MTESQEQEEERTFTLQSDEEGLVFYPPVSETNELFSFRMSLLVPRLQSAQLLSFESRQREFEWSIQVRIGPANVSVSILAISNLSGAKLGCSQSRNFKGVLNLLELWS